MAERKLEVLPYDHNWPKRFEDEAGRLHDVYGEATVDIFHIGSTSVPGLAAKPTIDILIEVETDTDIPSFDARMQALGYICRGEGLDAPVPGVLGRFYFVLRDGVDHIIHVHVCASGHADIYEKLCFRDYLRAHPTVAAEYGALKERLSAQYAFDNLGYMRGKDEFLRDTIADALAWQRARS